MCSILASRCVEFREFGRAGDVANLGPAGAYAKLVKRPDPEIYRRILLRKRSLQID
jgi:hypothetical protein